MTTLSQCPSCGQTKETLPSGEFAVCAKCGEPGCADCLPWGDGTVCLDCELTAEDDKAALGVGGG